MSSRRMYATHKERRRNKAMQNDGVAFKCVLDEPSRVQHMYALLPAAVVVAIPSIVVAIVVARVAVPIVVVRIVAARGGARGGGARVAAPCAAYFCQLLFG